MCKVQRGTMNSSISQTTCPWPSSPRHGPHQRELMPHPKIPGLDSQGRHLMAQLTCWQQGTLYQPAPGQLLTCCPIHCGQKRGNTAT